jgi:predicted CoA-binding protein
MIQGANKKILSNYETIAVVGLSKNPEKDSHKVSSYMQKAGYKIIPVNPSAEEILGERAYKSLRDIAQPVDVVNIFRPSAEAGAIVDAAVEIGARAVWMQLGIFDEDAAKRATEAGLDVVMDWCIMTEHMRLMKWTK